MNAPLTPDERAELEQLRKALPMFETSFEGLSRANKLMADLNTARVLRDAGVTVSLIAIKDHVQTAIDLLKSGKAKEALGVLEAMIVEGK